MRLLPVLAVVLATSSLLIWTLHVPIAAHDRSPRMIAGQFTNTAPKPKETVGGTLKLLWEFLFDRPAGTTPPQAPPVRAVSAQELAAAPDHSLYRLGHSTLLIKLRGGWWLTDPVFSKRASPVQWMGPKRFHAPPIALKDLPPIRGVVLSHDHYDHLDRATIKHLATRAEVFLTPLGVGDRLIAWGVPRERVHQLDWWEQIDIDGVRFVATPAQHFSGRGLRDANRTLWASWVILDDNLRVFFSGDTGYFDGFKRIGERYGPFDVTFIETGAYDAKWPFVHMQPEQTVQAHQDLRGRWLLPIHNGTFDLALHQWDEPFERVSTLAAQRAIPLATPGMGERMDLDAPQSFTPWWRTVKAAQDARRDVPVGSAM